MSTTERTEPSVTETTVDVANVGEITADKGRLGGLLGKKQPRSVKNILGGFNQLVTELKDTIQFHRAAQAENEQTIAKLKSQNEARSVEIADAEHAVESISALVKRKLV